MGGNRAHIRSSKRIDTVVCVAHGSQGEQLPLGLSGETRARGLSAVPTSLQVKLGLGTEFAETKL